MKIGLTRYEATEAHNMSMRYIFRTLEQALRERHQLVYLKPNFYLYCQETREALALDFVRECDLIFDHGITEVHAARQRAEKRVPAVHYLHGEMPRGAPVLARIAWYLTTEDALVGNCTADLAIAQKFVRNGRLHLLPFAIDHDRFYPLDPAERAAVRRQLGFSPHDKVLLYPGRITYEKNIHTVLRVFSALHRLVPNVHLLLAGGVYTAPFFEFGLYAPDLRQTLTGLIQKLGIPAERVTLTGSVDSGMLHQLYNAADLVVNLTLHHDENFGYAQVEAMACGTPVVGTRWGGLLDTIADGVTGYRVRTVLTPAGVKVDWWDALNKILDLLLHDGRRRAFGQNAVRHTAEHYHLRVFARRLEAILAELVPVRDGPPQPLKLTRFARDYWTHCPFELGGKPRYRCGPRSLQLYQELIAPYLGPSEGNGSGPPELGPSDLLLLATPATFRGEAEVAINDPIYPFNVAVPPAHREAVRAALAALARSPAVRADGLTAAGGRLEALRWMITAGLLLRAERGPAWASPTDVGPQMGAPLFTIHQMPGPCDVLVLS